MARTTVRNVDVVARLKARAKRRVAYARALADRIRRRLAGRPHTDSVELLAEDRAR